MALGDVTLREVLIMYALETNELRKRVAELEKALGSIIARWDTPAWKDVDPTARVIGRARELLKR